MPEAYVNVRPDRYRPPENLRSWSAGAKPRHQRAVQCAASRPEIIPDYQSAQASYGSCAWQFMADCRLAAVESRTGQTGRFFATIAQPECAHDRHSWTRRRTDGSDGERPGFFQV